jgi:hypothetical protein
MSGIALALTGVLPGDAVTGSGAGTFASKNVGTGLAYTLSGLALTGADAQDYYLTNGMSAVGSNGSITPLALAVTGVSAAGKTYDGTTMASLTGTPAIASLGADQVSVASGSVQASFQNASVGQGKLVTVTGYALSGADAADYSVIQPTGLTASITPAPLTLSGTATATKTYDGTPVATLSGGSLSGLVPADQSSVSLQGTYASANAAQHIAVATALTGADAGDYVLVNAPTLYGTITPRTVTLNANETAASKLYDGTTAAVLSGGPLNNIIPADSGGLSLVGTFASPNVGQHIAVAVALSGAAAGNYLLGGSPVLAANITPAPLLATANAVSIPRGGVLPALSGTFSGFVDGQTLASLEASGYQASWTSTVNDQSARGYYPVTGAFNDANYEVVQAAGNATAFDVTSATPSGGSMAGNVLASIVSAALPGGGPFGAPGTGVGAGSGTSISGNGYAAAGNANGVAGAADGSAGAQGSTQADNLSNGLAYSQVDVPGDTSIDAQGAGMNGSTAGAATRLSLGANTASTADDGTVTLSASGASAEAGGTPAAVGGATDVGSGGNAASGASPGGTADGGDGAHGTRQAALTGYGGHLSVLGGGVNASGAH